MSCSGKVIHHGNNNSLNADAMFNLAWHPGEAAEAHIGDRILLVATHPDSFFKLIEASPPGMVQHPDNCNKR